MAISEEELADAVFRGELEHSAFDVAQPSADQEELADAVFRG